MHKSLSLLALLLRGLAGLIVLLWLLSALTLPLPAWLPDAVFEPLSLVLGGLAIGAGQLAARKARRPASASTTAPRAPVPRRRSQEDSGMSTASCFISYSTQDEAFAQQLHARLEQAGVETWFAPADVSGGKKLHEQIEAAIHGHQRLLLVLSAHSMASEWVMTEIRLAVSAERGQHVRKLFPLRLVSFDQLRNWSCFDGDWGKDLAVEVREYFIPDFSNWRDATAFETAFARLLRDLQR